MIKLNVTHTRILKQALNHGLFFKKVDKVKTFNQNAWLKSYNDINSNLRKKAKDNFEKKN